jgi:hypothetical protein
MAVKSLLENLDDVPEALHSEYKEQEIPGVGKRFVLDVEGYDQHPLVRNLKSAHDKVKGDKDKFKTELDALAGRFSGIPEDLTAEQILELYQNNKDGKGPDVDKRLADLRTELERKRNGEVQAKDQEIAARDARNAQLLNTIKRFTVDDGLTNALVEVGVAKELLPAARALLKERGVIEFVEEDGKFSAVAKTDAFGDIETLRFVQEWSKTDEGKAFVPKPTGGGASGTGNQGRSSGENPFSAEHWNVTKQGAVVVEKGEQFAANLARLAGTTIGGPKPAPRVSA